MSRLPPGHPNGSGRRGSVRPTARTTARRGSARTTARTIARPASARRSSARPTARPTASPPSIEGVEKDPEERQKLENRKRTFLAASTRTDRSLDDRVKSAQDASDMNKLLHGRALLVTREAVKEGRFYQPDLGENSRERERLAERGLELERRDAELTAQLAAADAARRNRALNPQTENSGQNHVAPQVFPYYSVPGLPQTFTAQFPEAQVTSGNLTIFPHQPPFAPAYDQGQQQFSMPQTPVGYPMGGAPAYTAAQVPNQAPAYNQGQQLSMPQTTVGYTMGDAPTYTASQVPNQMQQDVSVPQMPDYTMPDAPGLSAPQPEQYFPSPQMPAGMMENLTLEEEVAQIANQVTDFSDNGMTMMSPTQSFTTQAQNNMEELPGIQPTPINTNMDLPENSTAQVQSAVVEARQPQGNQDPTAQAQGTTPEEEHPPTPCSPPVSSLPDVGELQWPSDEDIAALFPDASQEIGMRSTYDPALPVIEENGADNSGPVGGSSTAPQDPEGVDLMVWSDETTDFDLSDWVSLGGDD